MTNPNSPEYHNEDAARARLENLSWPNGPICPHCGSLDNAHKMTGASTRPGLYKCRDCRKPFSVRPYS
jgi:transposase-like protein